MKLVDLDLLPSLNSLMASFSISISMTLKSTNCTITCLAKSCLLPKKLTLYFLLKLLEAYKTFFFFFFP